LIKFPNVTGTDYNFSVNKCSGGKGDGVSGFFHPNLLQAPITIFQSSIAAAAEVMEYPDFFVQISL
jgi:hypothetical protein